MVVVIKMRAAVLVLAIVSLVAAQSATTGRVLQLPVPQTTNRPPSTNTQAASANTNELSLQLPVPQTTSRPPSTTTHAASANTYEPTTQEASATVQPMGTNTFGEPSAQTQDDFSDTGMPSAAPETSTFSPSPTPSSTRPPSSSAPPSTSSRPTSSSFSSAVPSTSSSASPSPSPAASSAASTPPSPPPRVSGGTLAGVVIGSVLGAVLIVGLAYILIRRRHVRSLAELGTFNVDEETAKPTPYVHGKVDDETFKPPFFVDEEPKSDPYAHASDETLPKTMLASYPPAGSQTDEKTHSVASQIHPTTPSQPASSFLAYMHRENANAPRRAGTPLPPVPLRQTSLPDPLYAPQVASRRFHAEDALDAIEGEELPPMYNPRWAARRTPRRGGRSGIGRSATTRL